MEFSDVNFSNDYFKFFFKTHKFTSKIHLKHTNLSHKFKYHYTKIDSCILTHDHQFESLNNV